MGARSKQIITMLHTIGHFVTTMSQNLPNVLLNKIGKFISFFYSEALLNVRPEAVFSLENMLPAGFIHKYIMQPLDIHASKQ